MTFSGAYRLSILAQQPYILVAPLVFLWIMTIHAILSIEITTITILLIGAIVTVYQQFSVIQEDLYDGFFEHCHFNGLSYFSYAIAKSLSVWLTTLLPMALVLVVFGIDCKAVLLTVMQWMLLSICIACLMTDAVMTSIKPSPLNLLLAWLPLSIAPLIFLVDYLHDCNTNSLLIFLGCDTILVCTVCLSFNFTKIKA